MAAIIQVAGAALIREAVIKMPEQVTVMEDIREIILSSRGTRDLTGIGTIIQFCFAAE